MSIRSILDSGAKGTVVDVECHLSNGLPIIIIVGLGNKAVEESKERVRSAFVSSKLTLPRQRITINLAPADIPKDSTSLDVSIATAILVASDQVRNQPDTTTALIGELGLDGTIRAVRGIIGKMVTAMHQGFKTFYVPRANLEQALLVPGSNVISVSNLRELYDILSSPARPVPQAKPPSKDHALNRTQKTHAFSEIVGQQQAKRAVQIAAAGGHNILLCGPPGTGKSMLAKALPAVLPPLNSHEMLDVTHLHSLTSPDFDHLVTERPFRAPHHTASYIAMIGGGSQLRPGEVSLSHHGILFLDELPEFPRQTIEALRQPLEDRYITIARAKSTVRFPADFILVATANPCPCGFYGTDKPCSCPVHLIMQYQQKISRPILDRIDLYVSMEQVDHTQLLRTTAESDEEIRQTIMRVRHLQSQRYEDETKLNAHMTNSDLKTLARLSATAKTLLDNAGGSLQLSARAYMRAIKVARTIADLDSAEVIETTHISEALRYRNVAQTPQ